MLQRTNNVLMEANKKTKKQKKRKKRTHDDKQRNQFYRSREDNDNYCSGQFL